MVREIGVGIIGCGAIASNHATNYIRDSRTRIVAVADVIQKKAKDLAQRFRIGTWYTDYRELLNHPDIDIVSICLPHNLHAEASVAAAESGKHILCEKPLAIDLEQVDSVVKAVRKARVKLGVVFQSRFREVVRKAKKEIENGTIGDLVLGDLQIKRFRKQAYYDTWRGKRGGAGGVLMNQAIHAIDLFQMFMGSPSTLIGKVATKTHEIEVEDTGIAILTFKSGALGVLEACTSIYPSLPIELNLHGTVGSILIKGNHCNLITPNRKEKWIEKVWPALTVPPFVNPKEHKPVIRDFVSAIIEDREPEVTGEEARKSIEIACAIFASSDRGEPYIFGKQHVNVR